MKQFIVLGMASIALLFSDFAASSAQAAPPLVWSAMALPERVLQHIVLKRVPSGANRVSAQVSA